MYASSPRFIEVSALFNNVPGKTEKILIAIDDIAHIQSPDSKNDPVEVGAYIYIRSASGISFQVKETYAAIKEKLYGEILQWTH